MSCRQNVEFVLFNGTLALSAIPSVQSISHILRFLADSPVIVDDMLLSIFFLQIIEYFYTVDHTTLQVLGAIDK